MLLSGSMESDNHNGALEIFDKRSDINKDFFCTCMAYALKW